MNYLCAPMFTEEEKGFIAYWEKNRIRKKKVWRQLAVGLPLGVLIAGATGINYFSGWYTRARMQLDISASGILVVLIALLLTVIFIVVFSAKHRWEMNEQHYRELISRNKTP